MKHLKTWQQERYIHIMIPIIFIAVLDTLIPAIPQAAHIDERYGQSHEITITLLYQDTLIASYPDIFDSLHVDTIAYQEIHKNDFSIRCRFRHAFDFRPPYAQMLIDTTMIFYPLDSGVTGGRPPCKPLVFAPGAPDFLLSRYIILNGRTLKPKGLSSWHLISNSRKKRISRIIQ